MAYLPTAPKLGAASGVYCIFSESPFFLHQWLDALRKAHLAAGYERQVLQWTHSKDWLELTSETQSMSLFSGKRFLDIRLETPVLDKTAQDILFEICSKPDPNVVICFWSEQWDRRWLKAKWFLGLADRAAVHVGRALKGPAFSRWLEDQCRTYELSMTSEMIQQMVLSMDGNALAADQVLRQLALLSQDHAVTMTTLEAVLSQQSQADIFEVMDVALAGNAAKAQLSVLQLQATQAPVLSQVAGAMYLIRQLSTCLFWQGTGLSGPQACQKAQVFSSKQTLFLNAASRLDSETIDRCIRVLARAERQAKLSMTAQSWQDLLSVVLAVSGISAPLEASCILES